MEEAESITRQRLDIWQRYHKAFAAAEQSGKLIRPVVPDHCEHNAHMYQLLLPTRESRDDFIHAMKARGVSCLFHYVPLHTAEAGKNYGRAVGDLPNTVELSNRLVRLPLWLGLEEQFEDVIGQMHEVLA